MDICRTKLQIPNVFYRVGTPLNLPKCPIYIAAIEIEGGVVVEQGEDYLAAEFTSAVFGFVDDVEFRRGEYAVHVRSASRVGYSDAGANAARVAALRGALNE